MRRPARDAQELERARSRLLQLNEIGKLLARFESFETTVPAVIALLGETLGLESAILILEAGEESAPIVWQPADRAGDGLRAARTRATRAFGYLVRSGDLAGAEEQPASAQGSSKFIALPLAVSGHPIFGVLQLEAADPFRELDLVFADAAANQLAIALDRTSAIEANRALAELRREEERTQIALARAGELAGANAELERSNAELLQYAHVTSHDLKEPLRVVRMFIGLLEKRLAGEQDQERVELFAHIREGAERMSELIDAILSYAQIGRSNTTFAQVDCEAVLRDALSNLQAPIEETGAAITHDPLPVVRGDRALLTRLLQNVLANSLKFRGRAAPVIHVSVSREKGHWVFSVRDNGMGFENRHCERIFQMFQRLNSRSEYPGTGIGLAVCRKVVEEHGGRIRAESAPGAGTTISFTLP